MNQIQAMMGRYSRALSNSSEAWVPSSPSAANTNEIRTAPAPAQRSSHRVCKAPNAPVRGAGALVGDALLTAVGPLPVGPTGMTSMDIEYHLFSGRA